MEFTLPKTVLILFSFVPSSSYKQMIGFVVDVVDVVGSDVVDEFDVVADELSLITSSLSRRALSLLLLLRRDARSSGRAALLAPPPTSMTKLRPRRPPIKTTRPMTLP